MFDPLKAYKSSMNDPEAKQKYDENYEKIFGHGEAKKSSENEAE